MRLISYVFTIIFFLSGCATNNYKKEIPIHLLSVGMSKQEVISKLGNPHRVVANEVVRGTNQQTWMYQQDKVVWLTGNAFLGGRVRNDQMIYLLAFADDNLTGWRDNDYRPSAPSENKYELISR